MTASRNLSFLLLLLFCLAQGMRADSIPSKNKDGTYPKDDSDYDSMEDSGEEHSLPAVTIVKPAPMDAEVLAKQREWMVQRIITALRMDMLRKMMESTEEDKGSPDTVEDEDTIEIGSGVDNSSETGSAPVSKSIDDDDSDSDGDDTGSTETEIEILDGAKLVNIISIHPIMDRILLRGAPVGSRLQIEDPRVYKGEEGKELLGDDSEGGVAPFDVRKTASAAATAVTVTVNVGDLLFIILIIFLVAYVVRLLWSMLAESHRSPAPEVQMAVPIATPPPLYREPKKQPLPDTPEIIVEKQT